MHFHRLRSSILPVVLITGCGGPNALVGDWTCPTGSVDWTNEMTLLEDLTGSVEMHYTQSAIAHHSLFDLESEDRHGGLYWLDVVCVDDCPEAGKEFRMTCELSEDELELDCEADGWYELVWERAD